MKKKIIIIFIIILLVLLSLNLFKKSNKEEAKEKIELKTGIAKNLSFKNVEYVDIKNNYIIMLKDNKIVIHDLLTSEEIKTNYDSLVENYDGNLLLFKQGKEYILTDPKGTKIDSSKKQNDFWVLMDYYTNKSYYIKKHILYDEQGNEIVKNYKLSDLFCYINNGILQFDINDKTRFINLNTKKTIISSAYYSFDDYLVIKINKEYYGYDFKTNTGKYYKKFKKEKFGYTLSSENEIVYLNDIKRIKKEDTEKIILNDNYYLDYSSSCGKLIRTKDNKELTSECFNDYEKSEYNKDLFILNPKNEEIDKQVLFPNGVIKGLSNEVSFIKDYVVDFDGTIYNMNAEEIDSPCIERLKQIEDNVYYCFNGLYNTFYNKEFSEIKKYNHIDCENDYCSISNDSKYGLWYKDKVLIEPKYNNVIVKDKYIIVVDLYQFNVYIIDDSNDLSIEEISIDKFNYDVDIEKLIKEYELEDIEDIIKDNEELFKKYAYIVLHNDNLGDYKKETLKIFKAVVLNKEHFNDTYFFDKLKKLKIIVKNKMKEGTAGEYYYDNYEMFLLKEYRLDKIVYYHELMHFLDYTFNEEEDTYYDKNQNKYLLRKDLESLDKKHLEDIIGQLGLVENRLITEAGAEYYMGVYFNEGQIRAYYVPTRIYIAFNYLFGSDKMEEVFFSNHRTYTFKNLLLENGLTDKEIDKLYNLSPKVTYENYSNNDVAKIADLLVKIYNNKYKKKWTSDKEFSLIISSLLANNDMEFTSSKNKNDYIKVSNKYNLVFARKLLKQAKLNTDIVDIPYYYKENDKTYLIIADYKLEYDFKNNKVLDYEELN